MVADTNISSESIHGYSDPIPIALHLGGVAAACGSVPMHEPCAAGTDTSFPPTFICAMHGDAGVWYADAVRAHAFEQLSSTNELLGHDVTISCATPPEAKFVEITGHDGQIAGLFTMKVEVYFFIQRAETDTVATQGRLLAYSGPSGGDRFIFQLTGPPPPAPPALPVQPLAPPPSAPLPEAGYVEFYEVRSRSHARSAPTTAPRLSLGCTYSIYSSFSSPTCPHPGVGRKIVPSCPLPTA